MAEADPGQLDVGIVGQPDPGAQCLDPGQIAVGIVPRTRDEPGITLLQIVRQLAIERRPDPELQLGGQRPKALDKHLGVNGAKMIRQIGIQPVTIENSQSHLLLLQQG